MSNFHYFMLFIASVFICSCTQVALKRTADKGYAGIRTYLNAPVLISNVIFFGATLANVYLMRYIKLSTAALLNSLTYVFIPVLSMLLLKEKISKRMLIGIALVLCGVVVYAMWGGV